MVRPYLLASLVVLLAGCAAPKQPSAVSAGKELTPAQYGVLSDADKVRYKNIVVRVPESLGGGTLLPFDAGPFRSPIEKSIHIGDMNNLIGLNNPSMFEL